jgi:hypothetical protein
VRVALQESGFAGVPFDDAIPPGALRAASVFNGIREADLDLAPFLLPKILRDTAM